MSIHSPTHPAASPTKYLLFRTYRTKISPFLPCGRRDLEPIRIAVHELKVGLSRYLAQARAGTVIEVTSHNKPVARLVGVPASGVPGIARLLSCGAAEWSGAKPAPGEAVAVSTAGKAVSELILEDRG